VEPVPRWAVISTFVLSLIGLGVATYLTILHFDTSLKIACSSNPGVSCVKVTTSAQSYFLGIPVAVLGLCQYVAMSLLNSPFAWRRPERWVHLARFVIAAVGCCFVLWLVYAEVVIIGAICEWCTSVHLITFAILIILTRVTPAQLGWTKPVEFDSAEAH
jgi:uncharacterized membrane protein